MLISWTACVGSGLVTLVKLTLKMESFKSLTAKKASIKLTVDMTLGGLRSVFTCAFSEFHQKNCQYKPKSANLYLKTANLC